MDSSICRQENHMQGLPHGRCDEIFRPLVLQARACGEVPYDKCQEILTGGSDRSRGTLHPDLRKDTRHDPGDGPLRSDTNLARLAGTMRGARGAFVHNDQGKGKRRCRRRTACWAWKFEP